MNFTKHNWYKVLFLFVFACLFQCKEPEDTSYSFFVAGHTYGSPNVKNNGFYPPFKAHFDSLKINPKLDFGVLTGDFVYYPTPQNYDYIDADLKILDKPVYFAIGNHEMNDKALFESRYGVTYQSFVHRGDLFIILDPNLDMWNISGEQLEFLKASLTAHHKNVTNIFVFFHQVLWWQPEDEADGFILNSLQNRADSINFYEAVEPLFLELPNPVYMFAGDVGATMRSGGYFTNVRDNITYIASGMGGKINPTFLLVDITHDKTVQVRVIPLDE